jgi:hypothetical protein
MITIEMVTRTVSGVQPEDLRRWIDNAWVRPDGEPGHYRFHDIDVARLRLIVASMRWLCRWCCRCSTSCTRRDGRCAGWRRRSRRRSARASRGMCQRGSVTTDH